MRFSIKTSGMLAVLLVPTDASAHPAIFHDVSAMAGLLHPFTGLDHLLAMVAVGLLASRQSGHTRWLWPLGFMSAMLVGGMLGKTGFALPLIEPAIAASLLVFGLMIATLTVMPAWTGFGLIAGFGLFHGNAHGLEAPAGEAVLYGMGFLFSTALLHATGLVLGIAIERTQMQRLLRAGGGVIALAGGALLLA